MDFASLERTALRVAGALLCIILHEMCHGFAAYALGDPTAKRQHRLSLNPLHHIDWLGFVSMVITGVGWAKPVPVDMRYFKHPKQGMALTALAGPVSNLVLALRHFSGVEDVAYVPVWGQGHVMAERSGTANDNLLTWVAACCQ